MDGAAFYLRYTFCQLVYLEQWHHHHTMTLNTVRSHNNCTHFSQVGRSTTGDRTHFPPTGLIHTRCACHSTNEFEVIDLNNKYLNFIPLYLFELHRSKHDGASSACEGVSPCCRRCAVKMSNQLRNVNANVLFTEVVKYYFPILKFQ